MTSREKILKQVRSQHVPHAGLPALAHEWIRYDEPIRQFQAMIEAVGGRFMPLAARSELPEALRATGGFAASAKIVSAVPGVASTVDLNAVEDPHELESVDWAVMPGLLGVAENGAIWVCDSAIKHRAIYFIVQHLALVIEARSIVHNLHEAYHRITIGQSDFGVFISGPSKTADIEQSLVIGAHGPRSLTVFCVGGAGG